MRDLIKVFLAVFFLLFSPFVIAGEQKKNVLIIPDNIVTDTAALDSFIYDKTSEFFASEVINILNKTDFIQCPTVSDERQLLKSSPAYMIPAKTLTNTFKTTYNIDYPKLKKISAIKKNRYVLLLTSTIDAENYVMRRTVWDFLNIAGASVIDPAYKISTYAALVDTNNNIVLWSNTFYKTISVVEGRILTRGPSPQTEQLQKIRDYSRMLCPEIAENVQKNVLSDDEYAKESKKVYYDMSNFDNVFTKKYRRWNKEGKKDWEGFKSNTGEKCDAAKTKVNKMKENHNARKIEKQQKKLEVKAEQYKQEKSYNYSESTIKQDYPTKIIQPLDYEDQTLFEPINIKRRWQNRLYGEYESDRPPLRGYDNL